MLKRQMYRFPFKRVSKKIEINGRITNPKFLHVTGNGKQLKVHYVPNRKGL